MEEKSKSGCLPAWLLISAIALIIIGLIVSDLTIDSFALGIIILVIGIILLLTGSIMQFIQSENLVAIQEEKTKSEVEKKKEDALTASQEREKLIVESGFTITKKMENTYATKLSTVTIDDNKKVVIFDENPVQYENITSVELITYQKQTSTTTTGKNKGISRAVVGGVIAGGAGAIVGAATAKGNAITNTSVSIENTGVRVYLADIECPRLEIYGSNNKAFLLDVYSTLLAVIAHK